MTTNELRTVVGVDLGDKLHAVCALDQAGGIVGEFTVRNRAGDLLELAEHYPGALFAMEVGAHSPWVSRLLEGAGCQVVVANARKLRAVYQNERKCDEADARMIARLARADPALLHPIAHGTELAQRDRLAVTARDALVRARVNIICSVRSSLKSLGLRLPKPSTPAFAGRARTALAGSPALLGQVAPSLDALDALSAAVREFDREILRKAAEDYPAAGRLQQVPGVGPVTALSFVLAVGDPERFPDTRDVGAYLGLVPRRDQSGSCDRQLPITKAGNPQVRRLLVQAAQYILGHFGPDCDLRRSGLRLAQRGGRSAKRKAVVATARKLAVLLLALWKSGADYQPLKGEVAQ